MNLDPSVKARLARLDPNLEVTFSPYLVDPETRTVIETDAEAEPVHDPQFYLWIKCPDGKKRLVNLYSHFGHEQCAALESDLARFHNPMEVLAIVAGVREKLKQAKKDEFQQLQRDKIAANRNRIHDLIFEGKDGTRQAKPFSAPGLGSRSTPGTITMDPKEDGWELPG